MSVDIYEECAQYCDNAVDKCPYFFTNVNIHGMCPLKHIM